MTSGEPVAIASRETKPVRSWRARIGRLAVLGLLLLGAVMLWLRPTRVTLSDGRLLIVDKVTAGSTHIAYERVTLKNLWNVVTLRSRTWPHTMYQGEKGTVGVFYHCEPSAADDVMDSLYLADSDGWWWSSIQTGDVGEGRHLAVFPPIDLPSSPRFEFWSDTVRMGGGPLRVTPPRLARPNQRTPAPFPIRWQKGETLVVVDGVDVTTRDDVRPSEADVHLKIETFRAGRPVRMVVTDLIVTNNRGRGGRCKPDAEGRFRTTLSPFAPYWNLHFFVSWESEPTGDHEEFVDLVVRPQILGRTPGRK